MSDAADHFSLPAFSNAISRLVRGAGQSIVGIHSRRSRGSGFAWRPGLIVTASEALADDGRSEVVLPGGEVVAAALKGRDASTDIALLRIDRTDLTPLPASIDAIETGSVAVVVGADEGAPIAALGVVARAGAAWRSLRGGEIDARIELDVALRASAEGGPVLDAAGRAIGMAVFGPRRRVLVIPWSTLERVAAKLDSDGRIARGYLGLGLQPVRIAGRDEREDREDREGAMVMTIDAAGPGAVAGVRQGDVIVGWNGRPLHGILAILRGLGPDSVGSVVRLSARRAGEPAEFDVTIGARPDA
jgi:S1-C subfamily serine protease